MKPSLKLSCYLLFGIFSIGSTAAIELPVCVNKKTSTWRIVASIKKCNLKKENAEIINSAGLKGDKGEDGRDGGVSVYDANNQFLGYDSGDLVFLPTPINAFAIVSNNGVSLPKYNPDSGYVTDSYRELSYHVGMSQPFNTGIYQYFLSTDCSGSPVTTLYERGQNIPLRPLIVEGVGTASGKYFVIKEKAVDHGEKVNSSTYLSPSAICRTLDQSEVLQTLPSATELIEVTIPFTLPITLPLRYE